ncbi:MAG: hypothetical protein E7K04_04870 [Helicobacter sp.]|nr:hypothetical protein [Helicobacter sp.]
MIENQNQSQNGIVVENNIKLLNTILSVGFSKYIDPKSPQNQPPEAYLCDSGYGIFGYSLQDKKLIFGKKVSKNEQKHHIYFKGLSCSDSGTVALCAPGGTEAALYDVQNDKLALSSRFKLHKAPISCSIFSNDGSLFATGGEDGKVFIHSTKAARLYAILPTQPDYISCMKFDSKNNKIAIGTYDCRLLVYDLRIYAFVLMLDTPSVVSDCSFFSRDRRLFFVCKDGDHGIYSFRHKRASVSKSYDAWLQNCTIAENDEYAIISSRSQKLFIHSLKDNSKFYEVTLSDTGVSFIRIFLNYLCICFANGSVSLINLDFGLKDFLKMLDSNDFKAARDFAQNNNIFLKLNPNYSLKRTELWPDVLKKISGLLVRGDVDGALNLAQPFLEDVNIEREFRSLLDQKNALSIFVSAVDEGRYTEAYKIADEQESIQSLEVYKSLEGYYQKLLDHAQKLLEEDYNVNINRVKSLLLPFIQVPSKKPQIESLLNNFHQYEAIADAIKIKDYKKAMDLAKQYSFLQTTRAYQKAFNHYEAILLNIQDRIISETTQDLLDLINSLAEIFPFVNEARELKDFFQNQEKLRSLIQARDYVQCYALVAEFPKLVAIDSYLQMEEGIVEIFKRATNLAQLGKTSEVFDLTAPFFALEPWKNRLDNVFQISYFYEIKNANLKDLSINWKKVLTKYVSFFGKDGELMNLCLSRQMSDIFDRIDTPRISVEYERSIIRLP